MGVRSRVTPRVDSISPSMVGMAGGAQVTLKGSNLWTGAAPSEFSPPVVVCMQNRVCDVDYFQSGKNEIICRARPFNGTVDPEKGGRSEPL